MYLKYKKDEKSALYKPLLSLVPGPASTVEVCEFGPEADVKSIEHLMQRSTPCLVRGLAPDLHASLVGQLSPVALKSLPPSEMFLRVTEGESHSRVMQHSNTNRANSDRANSNSSSSSSSRGDTSRTCSGLGGSLNGQWDRHRRWFTTECRCQCTGARPTPVKQGQPCRLRCSLLHRGRPSPRSRRSVTLVAACLSLPSQQVPCTRPWS